MQTLEATKQDRCKYSRLSKIDIEYKSVQDYISDIGPLCEIRTKPFREKKKKQDWKDEILEEAQDFTEQDFINFLEIIDYSLPDFLHHDEIMLEANKVHDINSFCEFYGGVMQNYRGFEYNKKSKVLIVPDNGLEDISRRVMNLNMYLVVKARYVINHELWCYLMYTANVVLEKAMASKLYGSTIETAIWYYDDIKNNATDKEEYDMGCDGLYSSMALYNIIQNFLPQYEKGVTVNVRKLNDVERKLYETAKYIAEYNEMVASKFVDVDSYKNMSFEDEKQDKQWYENLDLFGSQVPITEFYNGYYILSFNSDKTENDYTNHYVDYINSYENEMWWHFGMYGRMTYTKNSRKCQNIRARDKVVKYYDSFNNFNKYLEQLL